MRAYCDGASYLNKGGCGIVFYQDRQIFHTLCKSISPATCNIAELRAILFAIEWALQYKVDSLSIFTDSLLSVNFILKKWKCRKDHLIPIVQEIREKALRLSFFEISWISRDYNKEADRLSKKALRKLLSSSEQVMLFASYFEIQSTSPKRKKEKKENANS